MSSKAIVHFYSNFCTGRAFFYVSTAYFALAYSPYRCSHCGSQTVLGRYTKSWVFMGLRNGLQGTDVMRS